jgi:hypothetical protein
MTGDTAFKLPRIPNFSNTGIGVVGVTIDGGGLTPVTGQQGFVICPYKGQIVGATLVGDQVGSCVIDVWKALFPTVPTVANTITASALPTLSSAQISRDLTLVGWTVLVQPFDMFGFNLNSVSGLTRITLELLIRKQ